MIDDDVLAVARALAQRDGSSLGSALPTLARRGFRRAEFDDNDEDDVPPFRIAPESGPHGGRRLIALPADNSISGWLDKLYGACDEQSEC